MNANVFAVLIVSMATLRDLGEEMAVVGENGVGQLTIENTDEYPITVLVQTLDHALVRYVEASAAHINS